MYKKTFLFFIFIGFFIISIYAEQVIPEKHQKENWYFNAKWLLENNKFNKALDAIEKAIIIDPDDISFRRLKEKILIAQEDFFKTDFDFNVEKGIVFPEKIEKIFPTYGNEVISVSSREKKYYKLARYYADNHDKRTAESYINKAVKLNPTYAEPYRLLGELYFFDAPELAFSYFKRAFYLSSDPLSLIYVLSYASFSDKYDYVEMFLRNMENKYEKTDLGAIIKIFEIKHEIGKKIQEQFKLQNVDKIEYVDMPSQLSIDFNNSKAFIYKIFESADPYMIDNWYYNYIKGNIALFFIDSENTFKFYQKAYDLCPEYFKEDLVSLVKQYEKRSKIVFDPNSFEALSMKANNFYKNGNYDKSIEYARKALAKAEDRHTLYALIGLNYFKKSEYGSAKEYLNQAIEKLTERPDIYFTFGEIYFLERNFFDAMKNYNKAVELDDQYVDAIFKIGKIHSEQNEYEEALRYMDRVSDLDPENLQVYLVKGNIYTKTNRFDDAVKMFEQALNIDPEMLDTYVSMSIVYYKKWEIDSDNKLLDSAIGLLEKAKEKFPENDLVSQYLQYYKRQRDGG